MNNLNFEQKVVMFNSYLYFQILINVNLLVLVWLLLQKKRSDSKTKFEVLFFSYTKPEV